MVVVMGGTGVPAWVLSLPLLSLCGYGHLGAGRMVRSLAGGCVFSVGFWGLVFWARFWVFGFWVYDHRLDVHLHLGSSCFVLVPFLGLGDRDARAKPWGSFSFWSLCRWSAQGLPSLLHAAVRSSPVFLTW